MRRAEPGTARDRCRSALETARIESGDPERALWPDTDMAARTQQHKAASMAHSSIIKYVRSLRSSSEVDTDAPRWSDDLVGGHEFADGTTLPVSLADVDEWSDIRYRHKDGGVIRRVHLPVAYSRELFRQADRVARVSGLVDAVEYADGAETNR